MAISIGKKTGGVRSRKKRENLLMKQQQRLEEQRRQEELLRQQEEQRIREEEQLKRREAERRLAELMIQELLMRSEMERMQLKADRRRGKRLWTAEERMAQRVFAAALIEAAAASKAERSGYGEGWMTQLTEAGAVKPESRGRLDKQGQELRKPQLELLVGKGLKAQVRTAGAAPVQTVDRNRVKGAMESVPQNAMLAPVLQLASLVLAPSAEISSGRVRTSAVQDRRMRQRPVRSP